MVADVTMLHTRFKAAGGDCVHLVRSGVFRLTMVQSKSSLPAETSQNRAYAFNIWDSGLKLIRFNSHACSAKVSSGERVVQEPLDPLLRMGAGSLSYSWGCLQIRRWNDHALKHNHHQA